MTSSGVVFMRQNCPLFLLIVVTVMLTDVCREHIGFFRHKKLDHFFHGNPYADDMLMISQIIRAMSKLRHAVEDESQYYGLNDDWKACCQIQNWTPSISPESLVTSNIWRQYLPNCLTATASSVSPASSSRE